MLLFDLQKRCLKLYQKILKSCVFWMGTNVVTQYVMAVDNTYIYITIY